jgi:hypothetical protein
MPPCNALAATIRHRWFSVKGCSVSNNYTTSGCVALKSWGRLLGLSRRLELPLAALCLVTLCGCAGLSREEQRTAMAPEPNRGNATVRAAVYVEAASNVAAPAPVLTSEASSTSKSVAARGKQDKRAVQPGKKDKPTAAPVSHARRVAAASETAGRPIDQKVPLSATGYRYTYAVELDAGGTRTFGFATDQGLLVGDRVWVNDTGVVALRK